MDNTLSIAELKRRGMAAIEDGLRHGPVRILKRNKSAAVVLSPDDYQRLISAQAARTLGMTAMQWLLAHSSQGELSKQEIDQRSTEERDW